MKKFNFKKISAFGASLLMAGMTAGIAAAANYPAPFVEDGAADVAIVYGTGAGVSSLDMVQAGNIQTDLGAEMPSTGTTTVQGGDSYKFEKTSTKFHLGDTITGVISSSLDEDELPSLLGDGKYIDNDNDEIDFTQKITMAASQLTMFEDNDYSEDDPTVGFKIASGATVLTYQLAFSDALLVTDMPTTDLPIMGKEYYVLSNTSTTITLLDSAVETLLAEGETTTIDGKTVSVDFITSASAVKLNVDGEVTTSLSAGDTYKLSDGSYLGIKEVLYSSKEGTVSKVEFSIGSGKLKLTDDDIEVQINDETISGLESDFSLSGDTISWIELAWKADDDLFITEDSTITMPGFEVVSMSFGGLTYPAEETIEVKQGGDLYATLEDFPLKDGPADINFLYATTAGTFAGLGKDANNRLITAADGANLTFDKDTDDYFVISWSDGSDAESYLARFTNFVLDGSDNETDFQIYNDGVWTDKKSGAKNQDTISIGNAEIMLYDVDRAGKNVIVANNSANTDFHTLYSKEGATVYLPYLAANDSTAQGAINVSGVSGGGLTGHNGTSFYLVMKEEDQNENKYSGDWINMTIGWDSSTTAEVEVSSIATSVADATSTEILETDVWRDFTYSALATEILYNKPSSGQKSVKLMYHGDEVAADVYITSADAVVVSDGASALGEVLVKDSEVSSVSSKNLIIVGGSCINSAAATVLGGAYCGAAFTEATGVGAGQFLIKGVADAYTAGKLALVVAGYEAADTVNAATYLTMKEVDTSSEYLGTSATEATLVTEETA